MQAGSPIQDALLSALLPSGGGRQAGAEERRPESLDRIAGSIFGLADEGIVICDARGCVRAINPAFSGITGYRAEEVIGLPVRHLRSPRQDASFYGQMLRSALSEGSWRGEAWMSRRQGHAFPALLTLSAVRDAGARVSHFIVIVSDTARLSERHTHLEHMAHHDALTGLPNRMLLLSRVEGALARSRRMRHLGALLFLDLDLFKDINDAHGHAAGDEVLREVAQRLTRRLRESDMAARFGGDEFVVLLEEIKSIEDAGEVARDVIHLVQTPIPLTDGRTCQVGASIGITLFQGDAVSAADLVRRADKALFEAKDKGGATYCYFNPATGSAPHAAN